MNRRTYIRHEYRINKKGAECFRSEDLELCRRKAAELNSQRPVYTMQGRSMHYGGYIDNPSWGPWKEVRLCGTH